MPTAGQENTADDERRYSSAEAGVQLREILMAAGIAHMSKQDIIQGLKDDATLAALEGAVMEIAQRFIPIGAQLQEEGKSVVDIAAAFLFFGGAMCVDSGWTQEEAESAIRGMGIAGWKFAKDTP